MKIGETVPIIQLPSIDGTQFDSSLIKNKRYLITFFRFATCPLCNLRVAQLVKLKSDFGDKFEVIAIFASEIDDLKKHTTKQMAKFPILSDSKRKYYTAFNVKTSILGMIKGMSFRLPTIIKGMFKGYIPREVSSKYLIMPLSILVDEKGIIQDSYQGKDEGDHIPIQRVISFASGE